MAKPMMEPVVAGSDGAMTPDWPPRAADRHRIDDESARALPSSPNSHNHQCIHGQVDLSVRRVDNVH
jgi:hypothetical protein